MRMLGLTRIMRLIRRHLAPPPCGGLHCSTLQHTATHCNLLRQTAVHCNTLQHCCRLHALWILACGAPSLMGAPLQDTVRHCKTPQDTATPRQHSWISAPLLRGPSHQRTAVHCSTLQKTAIDCNRLQQTSTDCHRLKQNAAHCSTMQSTLQHPLNM